MDAIYSMTALQRTPSKVKKAARSNLVRITEQGQGAYVFCSDEVFEQRIEREREDAAYEARVTDSVRRGISDIEEGRLTNSVDDAFERAAMMRDRYA